VLNISRFVVAFFKDDLFPSLPPRSQNLAHIGTTSKYDRAKNKWRIGKFPDIAVKQDHSLSPHFFQGELGYINHFRKTLNAGDENSVIKPSKSVMKAKKDICLDASIKVPRGES